MWTWIFHELELTRFTKVQFAPIKRMLSVPVLWASRTQLSINASSFKPHQGQMTQIIFAVTLYPWLTLHFHLISFDALDGENRLEAIDTDQANINIFLVSGMANLNAYKYTTCCMPRYVTSPGNQIHSPFLLYLRLKTAVLSYLHYRSWTHSEPQHATE